MARPPLPLGTWGEMRTYWLGDDGWHRPPVADGARPVKWRAICQLRGWDGKTRQVARFGTSEPKAKRNLRDAMTELLGKTAATEGLTPSSRFRDAAEIYLKDVKTKRVGTTYDRYEGRLRNHVLPRMGDLLLRECTAGRIERILDGIRKDDPSVAAETLRGVRTVISGVLQVAVKHEVIAINPAKSLSKIEGGSKRKAVAYDAEQLSDFLTKLDADTIAKRADLCDLIRFLFGTGCRFGEALGLRWCDCNLDDTPKWVTEPITGQRQKLPARSIWINGNIVDEKGRGLVRHTGKTFTSNRVLGLPEFLHTLLLVRCPVTAMAGPGAEEPVFPSGTLGWRHPSNVQRSVRRLRERINYPNFVTHIGRKTVATLLDEAGHSARQVADQLGHSQITTTQNLYMGRGMANPDAAKAIDAAHRTS
jgi:integrase